MNTINNSLSAADKKIIWKRYQAFSRYNYGRNVYALRLMDRSLRKIFHLVPLLLHCQIKQPFFYKVMDSPYGIAQFSIQPRHTSALQALLPDAEIKPAQRSYPLQSLIMMGSIGTIAQTRVSDFDYTIFIQREAFSHRALGKLYQKLQLIEQWGASLNAEIHFFLMDISDFKNNHFGVVEGENVGSAGGNIFKDEFYRTMLLIAGLPPLWWLEWNEDYNQREVNSVIPCIDLGSVIRSDYEDFLGTVLWQMNKSLGSPYKSLLKMALLECYLQDNNTPLLSCRLKENIYQNSSSNLLIDPYLLLLYRLLDYYQARAMQSEVAIIRSAFLQQLGIHADDVENILLLSFDAMPIYKLKQIKKLLTQWQCSPKQLQKLERKLFDARVAPEKTGVNLFFLQSYERLSSYCRDQIQKNADFNTISKEDMTVLGRRLVSVYSKPQAGKITVQPLLVTDIVSRHISLTQVKDKWLLYDVPIKTQRAEVIFQHLCKSIQENKDILPLLGWMVLNRVWKQDKLLYYRGIKTIDNRLLLQILQILQQFFLENNAFFPIRKHYLQPKYNVKVFITPHLEKDASKKECIMQVIIQNSWGEYYFLQQNPKALMITLIKEKAQAEQAQRYLDIYFFPEPEDNTHISIKLLYKMLFTP